MNRKSQQRNSLKDDVFAKLNGHCAYCGCEISREYYHVDHVIPKRRYKNYTSNLEIGSDKIENLLPACASCNSCKSDLSVEQFRGRVKDRICRLNESSSEYNIAKRFGLVIEIATDVVFYFEKIYKQTSV